MYETFPEKVVVTDQEIDLTTLTNTQKEYYRDLASRVSLLYEASAKSRVVVAFAGQSGSGKSVTIAILRTLLAQNGCPYAVRIADIDAFHYHNEYLDHTQGFDGTTLRSVKGRYDTYDVAHLSDFLADFVSGKQVVIPQYSRSTHNPTKEGHPVTEEKVLLLMAGLWFLRDTAEWAQVRAHIDHTFLLQGDSARLRAYSIERHVRGGRSREDAERFYDESDACNAREIAEHSVEADEVLPFFEEVR